MITSDREGRRIVVYKKMNLDVNRNVNNNKQAYNHVVIIVT